MIVVWGPANDPPVERVLSILGERGTPTLHIDGTALAALRYDVRMGVAPDGWVESGGQRLHLPALTGVYLRPGETVSGAAANASMVMLGIAASTPATVVNRPSAGRSNWSKPFQLRLIAAAGLGVPDTLVTTDPQAARLFLKEHERIVYKSVSGIRSIVSALDTADEERLEAVTGGPVQFQRWIPGRDIRVHVVGSRCFATAIDSSADDYRYAARDGAEVKLAALDIPRELGERLVALTRQLGLLVSGIDLRVTDAGEWFCFEVNPSPGFTFYEDATDQPIGEALADLLMQAQ